MPPYDEGLSPLAFYGTDACLCSEGNSVQGNYDERHHSYM